MHRKAFTLIELLVVISIIALLASVVLASLNSARDKGRMAAGIYFAAQVDHVVGDYTVGIWDFDECSGTSIADRSGFGSNGALTATPAWSTTDTPSGKGCSLILDGTSQYASGPLVSQSVTAMTYSVWVKPDVQVKPWGGFVQTFNGATLRDLSRFNSNTLKVNFRVNDTSQVTSVASLPLNTWSQVVTTYDGAVARIYINGALDISQSMSLGTYTIDKFEIGRNELSTAWMFKGLIDSARIFTKALTATEVGRLYALESSKHPNLASK